MRVRFVGVQVVLSVVAVLSASSPAWAQGTIANGEIVLGTSATANDVHD
jgi:hypothetical protein